MCRITFSASRQGALLNNKVTHALLVTAQIRPRSRCFYCWQSEKVNRGFSTCQQKVGWQRRILRTMWISYCQRNRNWIKRFPMTEHKLIRFRYKSAAAQSCIHSIQNILLCLRERNKETYLMCKLLNSFSFLFAAELKRLHAWNLHRDETWKRFRRSRQQTHIRKRRKRIYCFSQRAKRRGGKRKAIRRMDG